MSMNVLVCNWRANWLAPCAPRYDNECLLGKEIRVWIDPGGKLLTWTMTSLDPSYAPQTKRRHSTASKNEPSSP